MQGVEQAGFYADFAQFQTLRAQARGNPRDPETLRRVAGQFEALFLQLMLREMRKAAPADGLFDNDQTRFYQGMYDRQIASELTRGGGLGLADLLVRQLGGTERGVPTGRPAGAEAVTAAPHGPSARKAALPVAPSRPSGPAGNAQALDAAAWKEGDPRRFVADLLPHARRIEARLGIPAEAIIAQAALETGWGRAIPRLPDGRSTHNLFGIKADGRWQGERAQAQTLEFRDGALVRERAAFRVYSSPEASLEDYARFLESNPRYREALQAREPVAFARALARAGYATDPAYAEKIVAILQRPAFRQAIAALKPDPEPPMERTGDVALRETVLTPQAERGAS